MLWAGRKSSKGPQDPARFIENRNLAIDGQAYTDEAGSLTATQVLLRTHLGDKALLRCHKLSAEIRGKGPFLEMAFLFRFALLPRKKTHQARFLNLNLKPEQKDKGKKLHKIHLIGAALYLSPKGVSLPAMEIS